MNGISGKVLHPLQKSARIWGKIYPTVQKSKPNLGQGFARWGMVCQKSQANFCRVLFCPAAKGDIEGNDGLGAFVVVICFIVIIILYALNTILRYTATKIRQILEITRKYHIFIFLL